MSLKIRQTQTKPASQQETAGDSLASQKRKILIVDDEKLLLTTLSSLLSPHYDVQTANSGAAAISILTEGFVPDVILADQRMPNMSGAELLARSTEIVPKAVRMVLTGYTDVSDVIASINIGHVYLFLSKPWRDDDLLDSIASAVSHHDLLTQNLELRVTNLALSEANTRLERLNNEKNELIGIVAHDLRNPLTAILGMSELMVRYPADTLSKGYPDRIHSAGRRLVDLVNKLLDINLLEDGSLAVVVKPVDVARVAMLVADPFLVVAEEKGMTITLDCAAPAIALADETMVSQVIGNLLSNALKFSPLGASIAMSASVIRSADGQIADGQPSGGNVVRLSVRDSGPGITPDDQKKLFQKFTKLSARPTGGEYSSGLGLAIVKKLVESMHGRVWCESTLGAGAAFIVELPSAPELP
jgi:two-component system, sensor histidine kinase and response regulator